MNTILNKRFAAVFTAAVIGVVMWSHAGPLTPPPGPITSTGRFSPRIEIDALPFFITTPGSYYLAADLTAPGAGAGIFILGAAENVTIDLDGNALIGVPGATDAITAAGPGMPKNVTIKNGFIRNWDGDGIKLSSHHAHVFNMTVKGCDGIGINVGPGSIVRNSTVEGSGGAGIQTAANCNLTNCVSSGNGTQGVLLGDSCHISDCIASFNGTDGFHIGDGLGPLFMGCVLIGSTAADNGGSGFAMGDGNRLTDCTALRNGVYGFMLGDEANDLGGCVAFSNGDTGFWGDSGFLNNAAHHCTASFNGFGAGAGDGFLNIQRINDCSAIDNAGNGIVITTGTCINSVANENATSMLSAGIGSGIVAVDSTVIHCEAFGNADDGISAMSSIIKACTVNGNADDGIEASDSCHILQNNCIGNLDNGIEASGFGNTIERNHCVANGLAAIDTITFAPGLPNVVLGNRETGNPIGYDLDFGANTFGEIFFGPGPIPFGTGPHPNITY